MTELIRVHNNNTSEIKSDASRVIYVFYVCLFKHNCDNDWKIESYQGTLYSMMIKRYYLSSSNIKKIANCYRESSKRYVFHENYIRISTSSAERVIDLSPVSRNLGDGVCITLRNDKAICDSDRNHSRIPVAFCISVHARYDICITSSSLNPFN